MGLEMAPKKLFLICERSLTVERGSEIRKDLIWVGHIFYNTWIRIGKFLLYANLPSFESNLNFQGMHLPKSSIYKKKKSQVL